MSLMSISRNIIEKHDKLNYFTFPKYLFHNIKKTNHIWCRKTNFSNLEFYYNHSEPRQIILYTVKRCSPSLNINHGLHTTNRVLFILNSQLWKKYKFENEYEILLKNQKRRSESPSVLVIDTKENVSVMTLAEASILAKKRNLKLVKIEDPKSNTAAENRPVFQLMDGKQYHEEKLKIKENKKNPESVGFKGEKSMTITAKIEDYDLKIKIKQLIIWTEKNFQIKVVITNPKNLSKEHCESLLSTIEEEISKNGSRVLQKIFTQVGGIKFFINPPKMSNKISDDNEHNVDKTGEV